MHKEQIFKPKLAEVTYSVVKGKPAGLTTYESCGSRIIELTCCGYCLILSFRLRPKKREPVIDY